MKKSKFTITENRSLAAGTYHLRLSGDTSEQKRPGQFVEIELPELFLRRPISVCDWDGQGLTLIYKAVGRGTEKLAALPAGTELDLLTGLGNGFDVSASGDIPSLLGDSPLLIGGGAGVAPLYGLAKRLGGNVTAVLGWKTASEAFFLSEFAALGVRVTVTTEDGSLGAKGFVTGPLRELAGSFIYACGPMPMLRAVEAVRTAPAQYSLEERMGCGFGYCMGCSIMTKGGAKRVCREGPVFGGEELIWD